METDYGLLLGAAWRRPRCAGEDRAERRRKGRGAAQSAQGFRPEGAGGIRFPRLRLDRRASGQRHQRCFGCAQDELPQGQDGRADLRSRHQHHRRSAAPPRPALSAVRRRRRRRPAHGADRGWRTEDLAARQRHRARARSCHHRPRRAERLLDAVAGTDQPASGARHAQPRRTDQGHRGRLLHHRPDRLGRQHGNRRLQPRCRGLLDRERSAHLSGERGNHRGPFARHLPHRDTPQTICISATAPTRRPCAWKD